jgi:hypothetical protein
MLRKLADVELEPKSIPKEPRKGMHHDDVEGVLAIAGAFDHLLKLRSAVVRCGRTGLDILGDNSPAAAFTPSAGLRPLVGDG